MLNTKLSLSILAFILSLSPKVWANCDHLKMEANFSETGMIAYQSCVDKEKQEQAQDQIRQDQDSPDAFYNEIKASVPRAAETSPQLRACHNPKEVPNSDGVCGPAVRAPAPAPTRTGGNGGDASGGPEDQKPQQTQQQALQAQQAEDAQTLSTLNAKSAEDIKECRAKFDTAAKCCKHPIKCLSGSETASQGFALASGIGMAYGSASMGQASASNDRGQMQAICNAMKLASLGTAGANVGLGAVCSSSHNSCEDLCGAKIEEWERMKNGPATSPALASLISKTINDLTAKKNQCGGLATQAALMVQQGASTGLAASMFDQCKQLTAQSNSGFENMNLNRNNCADPAYANTAACVNCALTPTNPYCQGLAGTPVPGTVGSISTRSVAATGSEQFNVDTVGDGTRQLNAGGGDTSSARAQSFPNNSGGGIPGGMGGANAGGPDNRNQGPSGKPSADVLQGERSGGGYSVSGMGGGSEGGFAGYGGGGGSNSFANSLKGFDLKKYLPGAEKDPAARKLAAVGDPSKVINGKHGNIFADLSKRVVLICAQDRLIDCGSRNTTSNKPGNSL